MMFEKIGHQHGDRDGKLDGRSGMPHWPRPELALSIVSSGYRDRYLKSYEQAYRMTRYIQTQKSLGKNEAVAAKSKNTGSLVSPDDLQQAFDKGWADGYGGQPSQGDYQSTPMTDAYCRGYRLGIGKQDRHRADQLLKKAEMQKRLENIYRDSQSEMDR